MRSKAHIKSHPIHPILVCFPLAFYIGTLLFDSLRIIKDDIAFGLTGQYLHSAGIIAAVCAAVPGIIDYKYTVPPRSSAKKRAATHGIVNTVVLLSFLSWPYTLNMSKIFLLLLSFHSNLPELF
ncbi:MAG: DUF2231 domain-containing protein [Segetibacter sp.]